MRAPPARACNRRARIIAGVACVAAVLGSTACSLLISLDGLAGAAVGEAGATDDARTSDAPSDAPGDQAAPGKRPSYLFVAGGEQGGTPQADVFVARIAADGTLSAWTAQTPLPNGIAFAPATVTPASELVLLAGQAPNGTVKTLYRASIEDGGTLPGPWATGQLDAPRTRHAAAAAGNAVYVAGGLVGGISIATVSVATAGGDGKLGAFAATTELPKPRSRLACVFAGGRLYVTGGTNEGSGTYVEDDDVLVGDLSGASVTWRKTTPLPMGRVYHSSVVYGGRLYLFGDEVGREEVYSAAIGADGSVGVWSVAGQLSKRSSAVAVVAGEYIYVLGGDTDGTELAEVLRAHVESDGHLAPWVTLAPLPGPRSRLGAVVF